MSREHYKPHSITRLLVLLSLTGFTLAEPLLSVFGAEPNLFQFHNIDSPLPLVLYATLIAVGPAVVLWAASLLVGFAGSKVSTLVYYLFIFLLCALWLIQLGKWSLGIEQAGLLLAFSIPGATVLLFAYLKWTLVESWLKIAAIAPIISIVFFLQFSKASSLMDQADVELALVQSDQELPSVLFLMLDEFPTLSLFDEEGELDKVRFPHLGELSEQATWYRHYTVLADKTNLSVPSILSGADPVNKVPNQTKFPDNLFTLLAPSHYLTVFETFTKLCGLEQCSELPPGVEGEKPGPKWRKMLLATYSLLKVRVSLQKPSDSRLDDFMEELAEEGSPEIDTAKDFFSHILDITYTVKKPRRFEDFVDTLVPEPRPALYYLHIELPHMPWRFYPAGETYSVPMKRFPFSASNDDGGEWLVQLSDYRFMLQAEYTDKLLGEVISRLKYLNMWDEMLVVVTADHGRSFKLGMDSRSVQKESIDGIAYVPLFVKRPHQKSGNIDDSNMMAYDVVPAIADVLGIEIPWESVGYLPRHEAIEKREDEKVIFLSSPPKDALARDRLFGAGDIQKLTFLDSEHFPHYSSRWIAPGKSEGSSLGLLNFRLQLDKYWDRSPDDYEIRKGGTAVVDQLELLQEPEAGVPPLGVLVGNIESEVNGGKVLVAINGRFVTGSPLVKFKGIDNTFIAMLPKGALLQKNTIEIYLVEENGLVELALLSG